MEETHTGLECLHSASESNKCRNVKGWERKCTNETQMVDAITQNTIKT